MNPNSAESKTQQMSEYFVTQLAKNYEYSQVSRDLTKALPLIDQDWIGAAFTPEQDRNTKQKDTLRLSDILIEEINKADHIVLSVPMYNFSLPANVKSWFDHIARVGKTFKYTEQGPEGLVNNKPVSILVATGGTPLGSEADFLTPYLKQLFAFIGIIDVHVFVASDNYIEAIDHHIQHLTA